MKKQLHPYPHPHPIAAHSGLVWGVEGYPIMHPPKAQQTKPQYGAHPLVSGPKQQS